jgi:hypothetical protein
MPAQTRARMIPNNPHPPLPLIKITTQIYLGPKPTNRTNITAFQMPSQQIRLSPTPSPNTPVPTSRPCLLRLHKSRCLSRRSTLTVKLKRRGIPRNLPATKAHFTQVRGLRMRVRHPLTSSAKTAVPSPRPGLLHTRRGHPRPTELRRRRDWNAPVRGLAHLGGGNQLRKNCDIRCSENGKRESVRIRQG